ncbi:NAD-specific glutamate dehydrogenase [Cupriavidus sp. H18C1]
MIGAIARIVLGIDQLEIDARLQAQAGLVDAHLDHVRTADQDRTRQALVDHGLHRAQHALFLALGIGDTLGRGLGGREHRLHDQAGVVDVLRQLLAIGLEVLDRTRGHTRLLRGARDGRRDLLDQALVERRRDDVVGAELQFLARVGGGHRVVGLGLGQLGDRLDAGQLHFLGDLGRTAIERAAEDVREAEDVIDLVRIVRTAGGDDAVGARGLGHFRTDLRLGIGQRQDDGLVGHRLDHLGGQHAGSRAAEEHVRAFDDVGQRAGRGVLRVAGLVGLHVGVAAGEDHALRIDHVDVLALDAQAHHRVQARDRRGAGARHRHLDAGDVLADHLQAIEQRCRRNDRGAVLVIVEDGDVHPLAQLLLDVEALGRLDVLEVDTSERGLERGDDLDDLVRVARIEFDVEHVDAGELLEQAALAFHHRLAGKRADITQAQHRGAIGDHRHQVAARGVLRRGGGVPGDFLAGIGHARRIGQRQVALVRQRLGRGHLDLALGRAAVIFQRGEAQLRFRTVGGRVAVRHRWSCCSCRSSGKRPNMAPCDAGRCRSNSQGRKNRGAILAQPQCASRADGAVEGRKCGEFPVKELLPE